MTELGQMDPNLMLPPCFEATLHERCPGEPHNGPNMSDRPFGVRGRLSPRCAEVTMGPPHTVTTVAREVGVDARLRNIAVRQGVVDPLDVVRTKLCCQHSLGVDSASKDHHTAGVLVEPVHHAELRIRIARIQTAQQCAQVIRHRVSGAGVVGDTEHPGGLVNDDQIAIEEHDSVF